MNIRAIKQICKSKKTEKPKTFPIITEFLVSLGLPIRQIRLQSKASTGKYPTESTWLFRKSKR